MTSKLSEHIRQMPSRRDPPYRPAMTIGKEEAAELDEKLGDAANYDIGLLREMVNADPDNIEFRKALVSVVHFHYRDSPENANRALAEVLATLDVALPEGIDRHHH